MSTKTIGFIDHFLDEWHANKYPEWIRTGSFAGRYDVAYAWAETEKEGKLGNREWCREHGVQWAGSLEEVVGKSDCLVVLSPDNPERHEALSRLALSSGKPVYIDKTFAPDLAAARRMVALAERFSTPFFSSSALRFSDECGEFRRKAAESAPLLIATGGGGAFETYCIHQVEMIVAIFNRQALRIRHLGVPEAPLFAIDFGDGAEASLQMIPGSPFRLSGLFRDQANLHAGPLKGTFFPNFIEEMLRFFDSGTVPVPPWQTLAVSAILDATRVSLAQADRWIEVEPVC